MIKHQFIRKASLLALLFAISFVNSTECQARRRMFGHGHPVQRQNFPVYGTYKYSHYNYLYPKYIGGFNARYFDSIGIPSGDIGLRGNGIYMTPW